MRVLLAGAGGMVGRNLLEHPGAAGHDWLVPKRAELDLGDARAVHDYVGTHRPELIVHAAGRVGGIQANIAAPVAFLVDNWDVGRNVVLAARAHRVPRLLNLGSSCMYPRNCDGAMAEELVLAGPLEPTNEGYAIAKCAVARLCEFIAREQPALRYRTLIPCNLYGRFDSFDPSDSHLVPAVIRKVHEAVQQGRSEVEIWGDGTARREFLYAGDLADCLVRCLQPERFDALPPLMNVGLGHDHSVDDYYRAVAAVICYRGNWRHDPGKPGGMRRKLVAIDRLAAWGWSAPTDLQTGIRRTYEYFLQHEVGR